MTARTGFGSGTDLAGGADLSGGVAVERAAEEFGPFDGRVWLNTAHQGPLPSRAAVAAQHAVRLKTAPHRIADEDFRRAPERLRELLATLVGGTPEQVVLGDSTSHGLHLVANGLDWAGGEEVLTLAGDYPATVLPWQRLAGAHGVHVRAIDPGDGPLTPDRLRAEIGSRTRLVALTWVDSFTGRALDLEALGAVCRAAGVFLVVNASQALGARPVDVSRTPVDALVSCGYKWLCGPYATGFTWLHPGLLSRLRPQQAYWLAMQAGRGLDDMRGTGLRDDLGVRAYDLFCPAAFATTLPWTAALELLLATGVERIAEHDDRLVARLLDGLDPDRYHLLSPANGPARSTLVVLARRDGTTGQRHRRLTAAGIDTAYREGNIRISPHLFNTEQDVDRARTVLDEV
jgi:cysteine desulfurase / selenocysteine lyase